MYILGTSHSSLAFASADGAIATLLSLGLALKTWWTEIVRHVERRGEEKRSTKVLQLVTILAPLATSARLLIKGCFEVASRFSLSRVMLKSSPADR
jgi:hypothetical protein